ncbi:MAG TPA: hypothetical protein EYN79_09635 [Planctomycetes bacterium]|nr:hypothetical protein [Planctomycetota bacterium]
MALPPDLDRGPLLGASIAILLAAICVLMIIERMSGSGAPPSASAQEISSWPSEAAVSTPGDDLEIRLKSLSGHLSRFEILVDEYLASTGSGGEKLLQLLDQLRAEVDLLQGVPPGQGSPSGSGEINPSTVLSGPPSSACGPPDTLVQGSHSRAWCPADVDGGWEWIEIDFAEPVEPESVIVIESFNPGSIVRIESLASDGQWTELWSGNDIATDDAPELWVDCPRISATSTVRVILDTSSVAGFNQIDAIGVFSRGEVVWGTSARASSSLH